MATAEKKKVLSSKKDVLSYDERKELFLMGFKKLVDEYGVAPIAVMTMTDILAAQAQTQATAPAEEDKTTEEAK